MANFYASIGYDGQNFQGFQSQPHGNTVQDHLRTALIGLFGAHGGLVGVSRTDAGVHAYDQRVQFRLDSKIPTEKIPHILNRRLSGVRLHWLREMEEEFDIRSVVHQKHYTYEIRCGCWQPFYEKLCWQLDQWPQSISVLCEILDEYQGRHDFLLFSRNDPRRNLVTTVRVVDSIDVIQVEPDYLRINIRADGFLWYMVRYMVAYAVAVWQDLLSVEGLRKMLRGELQDRRYRPSIKPAPAGGLYLRRCELL